MSVCVSVCLSVCVSVCVCVCVHDNSKNNDSIHLKHEHIVVHVYENSSDAFDIGHCPIRVKVMASVDSSILNDRRSIVLTPSFTATVS